MGGSISASNQNDLSQAQLVRICRRSATTNLPTNPTCCASGCSHRSRGYHIPVRYVGSTVSVTERVAYLQPVAIAVYCALAAEFLYRFMWDRPVRRSAPVPGEIPRGTTDSRLKRMLQAMFIMTVLIVIRTIYRVIEFVDGWDGTIISTEWIFDVFDGVMITLAMFVLNIFHPGVYLRDPDHSTLSRTGPEAVVLEDHLKTSPPMMRNRSSSVSRHARAHAMPSASA